MAHLKYALASDGAVMGSGRLNLVTDIAIAAPETLKILH